MVYFLDKNIIAFPDPKEAEQDGLLAVGGDLTPEWLLTAYSYGIFPWNDYHDKYVSWYCPKERFVIFPDEIHISHSMRQLLAKGKYDLSFNLAFDDVIEHCSTAQNRIEEEGAWLGGKVIEAYKRMHELGYAFSVEVWDAARRNRLDDNCKVYKKKSEQEISSAGDEQVVSNPDALVGGLYGICIGRNFFGESMFSLAPSASKAALIYLARLISRTGGIIDCQFHTPHLESMGGRYISYEEYMAYLNL